MKGDSVDDEIKATINKLHDLRIKKMWQEVDKYIERIHSLILEDKYEFINLNGIAEEDVIKIKNTTKDVMKTGKYEIGNYAGTKYKITLIWICFPERGCDGRNSVSVGCYNSIKDKLDIDAEDIIRYCT